MKPCGCDYHAPYGIEYCPLHKAAPELLEACKATLIDLRVARVLSEKGFDQTIARLEEAIKKAEAR